ncbi:hypothetical protein [Pseudorhodobacter sp.]|uniref:AAA family ATPase n=1 Tax=Pseudorhodobacter sp. TaxID=1934400 RepID=UPI002647836F|nr:hypothetical protein [Pseudorhodobacter sp.]MDN5788374.1 hypothetical protein [Pseudorhodobacter sp.]
MPFDSSTSHEFAQYVGYVCSDQGAEVARAVVEYSGGDSAAVHGGGLSGAARLASAAPDGQIILAEIGNIPVEMACECVSELCSTGAEVIVLGERTDIATYRALRRAGATEYFSFPVGADEIFTVKRKTLSAPNVIQLLPTPAKAMSIAVMGSNGGVGASLLAQNLAFYAADPKRVNLRTGFLDADLQFGSQAIDLDRDETPGLLEALMAPDRVDATFLNATMDQINGRLSLYSHQVSIGLNAATYEAGLSRLLPQMRAEFDALVTDLPRGLVLHNDDLAKHIDSLVLVIPAGFAGVNAASRLIKRILAHNPNLRILPVLSELRRDAGLSRKDVQTAIGRPIVATLPRCDALLARAHRTARPLTNSQPRSAYAKAVRSIFAAAKTDVKTPSKSGARPFMKRIFG